MSSIRYPKKRIGVSPFKCKPCWKVLTKISKGTTIDELKQKTNYPESNLYVYLGLLKKIGLILVDKDSTNPRKKKYSLSGNFSQLMIYSALDEKGETNYPPIKAEDKKLNDSFKNFYFTVKDDENIQDLDFFLRTYMLNTNFENIF